MELAYGPSPLQNPSLFSLRCLVLGCYWMNWLKAVLIAFFSFQNEI